MAGAEKQTKLPWIAQLFKHKNSTIYQSRHTTLPSLKDNIIPIYPKDAAPSTTPHKNEDSKLNPPNPNTSSLGIQRTNQLLPTAAPKTHHPSEQIHQKIHNLPEITNPNYPPPPPSPHRPSKSAAVLFYSFRKSGIDVTPTGYKTLAQILTDVPFHNAIDSAWIKQVEAAILSYDRVRRQWGHKQTTKVSNIQPSHSKKTWAEWLGYQIDRFNERLIANTDWHGVYDFDMFLMDEGLKIGGDEEVKRILEVLVRNGWVLPVEEEESLYELLVRESWSF
ncbi:hypothetical protein TWF694_008314 [Orbilia ellipsospora]|uniref:Uncharacterized protein n=1 Tax=Orbilia ellipsospora TaxID=2528407 RepID=A0AAV9XGP4_9PEZI